MATTTIKAEICLYGNRETGCGWLARMADGRLLGDGETRPAHGFTAGVYLACEAIRAAGVQHGTARVFAPGGKLMADVDINGPGWFGAMNWVTATVVEISAEAIEAAAAG